MCLRDMYRTGKSKGMKQLTMDDSFEEIEEQMLILSHDNDVTDRIANTKTIIIVISCIIMVVNNKLKASNLNGFVVNIKKVLDAPENQELLYRQSKSTLFGSSWSPEAKLAMMMGTVAFTTAMANGGNGWLVSLVTSQLGKESDTEGSSGLARDMNRHSIMRDFARTSKTVGVSGDVKTALGSLGESLGMDSGMVDMLSGFMGMMGGGSSSDGEGDEEIDNTDDPDLDSDSDGDDDEDEEFGDGDEYEEF